MKKIIAVVLALTMSLIPALPINAVGGYEPGIYRKTNNESDTMHYEEVSFITGVPAIVSGTVQITFPDKVKEKQNLEKELDKRIKAAEREQARLNRTNAKTNRNTNKNANNINGQNVQLKEDDPIPPPRIKDKITLKGGTVTEDYQLKGTDANGAEIVINRTVSIDLTYEYYKNQKITTAKVTGYDETINAGGVIYTLNQDLSEISESTVTDIRPAIEYEAGNSNFNKVFQSGEGPNAPMIILQMDGKSSGYDEYWGSTNAKTLNYTIKSYNTGGEQAGQNKAVYNPPNYDAMGVNGSYTVKVSTNTNKDISYSENDPNKISFRGGYLITENNHSAMEYSYDINGTKGSGNVEFESSPQIKRLFAPVYTDMQGHWAEGSSKLISALGGFELEHRNFLPSAPISRAEFARAIVFSSGIIENDKNSKNKPSRLKKEIFSDVRINDPYYDYIKVAVENEIMIGREQNKFEPREPITRMEAIAILTNGLGLDVFIPNGQFSTGLQDEGAIPDWGYDSAYIAQAIGLIEPGGYVRPNEYLTKAEATVLLERYINYMMEDLKEDYMYQQINY